MSKINYAAETRLPAADAMNGGLNYPTAAFMLDLFGAPRSSKSMDCQPPTNITLKKLIVTRDVGPFRVTVIKPFADALERMFARVKERESDLYEAVGTAGGLCCRLIRGSASTWSNHSWGAAVDLTMNGELDDRGDGKTQLGLLKLYPYIHAEKLWWGAEYRGSFEDAMHIEASQQLLRQWRAEGKI